MTSEKKTEATSVLSRIAQATKSVGVLGKDRTNNHDNYSYLSEEAVKQAVQKVIAEFDIAPSGIGFKILSDDWRSGRQAEVNLIKLVCRLEWPDGTFCEGLGSGRDYGDKALLKAQTSAVREAWKNRLTIPTGMDPEKPDERPSDNRPQGNRGNARDNGQRPSGPKPAPAQPRSASNGESARLAAQLRASLIAELKLREHPGDLKDLADGFLKLPPQDRAPLWAAFSDRCKELGLDPGKTARTGATT